jgi:glycosyltransferase involved in cell wall biosynthesis
MAGIVRASRPRLVLFTPVPPVKSGTADYVGALLEALPSSLLGAYRVVFAVNVEHNTRLLFERWPLVDASTCVLGPDDVAVYFIANNHFHRHVLAALRRHDPSRPAVSVIHDLQCGMQVLATCLTRSNGFGPHDFDEFISAEFGSRARDISLAASGPVLGHRLQHLLLAQGLTLRKSDLIVVHSHYARFKLLCEYAPGTRIPPVVVAAHPDLLPSVEPRMESRRAQFVIGTFGWIGESKRTIELIQAFERFAHARPDCLLQIVGQLPPPEVYDPVSVAARSTVAARVSFHGYTDLESFNRGLGEADLVVSLRFPSCGETSGVVNRATRLGVPLVTSDYAALREEPSTFLCRMGPCEQDDLVQAMTTAYDAWRKYGTTRHLRPRVHYRLPVKRQMGEVLGEFLESREYHA